MKQYQRSETVGEIFAAFVKAQAELPDVPKARTAKAGSYSYNYADFSDIAKAVRPVLAKHGLAFVQHVGSGDGSVSVRTVVIHSSGEWFSGPTLKLDAGNTAQSTGSAISYGRRYSLGATIGLVTDSDDDGAAASPKPRAKPKPKLSTGWGIASEAQRKLLWAASTERTKALGDESITGETILREILAARKIESSKAIPAVEVDPILAEIEAWFPPGPTEGEEAPF